MKNLPAASSYDECHPGKGDHDRALRAIVKTPVPRTDPVFGARGPLKQLWR